MGCIPSAVVAAGGGVCQGVVSARVVCQGRVSASGGCVCKGGGVCLPGARCLPARGCLPAGVCPGGCLPSACWDTTPCEQNDWQTGVKTLPFHDFVCGR